MATELAWAAGFFDGEGNAYFKNGGSFALQAAQVHREPLDRFRAAVGTGKVYGPYKARAGNRQPYYSYAVSGLKAEEAYTSLRPYLSSIKRQQADAALSVYSQHVKYKRLSPTRLDRIRKLWGEHSDPLVGVRAGGRFPLKKTGSFAKKYADEFGYTVSGLRVIATKIEAGLL